MFPLAPDVTHGRPRRGIPSEWVSVPESRPDRVILYLHGGGYVIGSIRTHRELAGRISAASGARCLVIDYRLGPEHPVPAAVEDAVAAYRWLLSTGIAPERIAIAGDSAGGGLTLATLLALREAKLPLPAAGVCMSPWTDLEGTGASAQPGGADDPLLQLAGLREMGQHYAAANPRHPHAAPLTRTITDPAAPDPGRHARAPARRLARRREGEGGRRRRDARAVGGLIHVWQLFGPDVRSRSRRWLASASSFEAHWLGVGRSRAVAGARGMRVSRRCPAQPTVSSTSSPALGVASARGVFGRRSETSPVSGRPELIPSLEKGGGFSAARPRHLFLANRKTT
jgi:acetyl esterase/lipase